MTGTTKITESKIEASEPSTQLDWSKPGPGSWQLDGSHFEPDCSRLVQRVIAHGMTEGMAQGFDLIGGPLKGLEAAFVNGNFYYRLVPLVAGNLDLPLPPAPVLWVLTRTHPAFRRQAKKAERALAGRVWNEELADWKNIHRPYMIENSSRLTAEDPGSMTDEQLADHLAELIELLFHGATLHFRLHVSDLGPIGLLLVETREWGLDKVDVMATLAGSSPATSAPAVALAKVAEAVEGHGPFNDLDAVRSVSPEAAGLLDSFLDEYGWRLTTGYDLSEMTLHELPAVTLGAINAPARAGGPTVVEETAQAVGDAAADRLRQQLQPDDRDEFDRLVSDARDLYGLRDENGPVTYQWPAGLVRRALLEAGRRLLATGRINDSEHIFDLEADELDGLLRGASTPSVDVLADRCAERQSFKQHAAPAWLGPEPDDPPLWTMPSSLAKLMDVVLTVMTLIESDRTTPSLEGVGIGTEPYVGTARVVTDEIDALSRMAPGDVLVAPFTVPTYNAVLAIAGAVVVENGGLLCHAAVIAREYGIAGLVGVAGVTSQIPDGATVRVDPAAGTIRVLATDGV
ncbi:MAG: PEP-utilizing enzyme [Acidimicrobiales bacterium]